MVMLLRDERNERGIVEYWSSDVRVGVNDGGVDGLRGQWHDEEMLKEEEGNGSCEKMK